MSGKMLGIVKIWQLGWLDLRSCWCTGLRNFGLELQRPAPRPSKSCSPTPPQKPPLHQDLKARSEWKLPGMRKAREAPRHSESSARAHSEALPGPLGSGDLPAGRVAAGASGVSWRCGVGPRRAWAMKARLALFGLWQNQESCSGGLGRNVTNLPVLARL